MSFPKISISADTSQLIYAMLVIVLVPLAIAGNSLFMLNNIQKDIDYELNNKALLVESAVAMGLRDKINNPDELQLMLQELVNNLADIKAIEVFRVTQDNLVPLTTNSAYTKDVSDPVLNQLAWSSNQAYSKLVYAQTKTGIPERIWLVVSPIHDRSGTRIGLINLYLSAAQIDNISNRTIHDAIIALAVTMLAVLLLLLNHFRFFEISILFRQLNELDKLKDDFISMASHELKAPLTAISSYAYMLMKNPLIGKEDKLKRQVAIIYVGTERLKNLVDEILDVSRIEQGRLKLNMVYNDLGAIVENVITEFALQAQTKGLKIVYTKPNYPVVTFCDRDKVHQVFANLVSNAIKYTPAGEINIYHQIRDNSICTFVKDSGVGISKEQRANLFSKFYRIYNEKTKNVTGSGLGLWITKQLVEKMGGRIWVDSIENHGSQFVVSLPLKYPKSLNDIPQQT